jgi:hypothetical protein
MSERETSDMRSRLSSAKRVLLEKRLRGEWDGAGSDHTIPKRRETGPVALSFAQQRLWFLDRFNPGSPLYNLPSTYRIAGAIDAGALARSLNTIVRRHESLRTVFPAVEGRPEQVISPAIER